MFITWDPVVAPQRVRVTDDGDVYRIGTVLEDVPAAGATLLAGQRYVLTGQPLRPLRSGMRYESLDGKTRDRDARINRFQTDPSCQVFLISLKAGGVGLNLTAADYVFLLDPWWNPAAEAQAIDRAHRIGQSREVFAYRLIAEDTIEERVLHLQAHKRALADAVLSDTPTGLRGLTRADLEALLG